MLHPRLISFDPSGQGSRGFKLLGKVRSQVQLGNEEIKMVAIPIWPFREPRDGKVLTTWQLLAGAEMILIAVHETGAVGWRFLGKRKVAFDVTDFVGTTLEEMTEVDSSIYELADLPCGWKAQRTSAESAWVRIDPRAEEPKEPRRRSRQGR